MRRSLLVVVSVLAALPAVALSGCISSDDVTPPNDGGAVDGFTPPQPGFDAGMEASAPADGGNDTSAPLDGTAPDDGPSNDSPVTDANLPGVYLGATTTNVTTEGDDTLMVTLNGLSAPSSIEIDDGATPIATFTAAPYTKAVTFTYLENGTHTYTAKATLANNQVVSSAPFPVTVNIPANGFFVDPANGLDANTGTQASPFKTIQKAATSLTTDGQSIYLAPGTYDSATQTTMAFSLSHVTHVRGTGAGVIAKGIASAGNVNMFLFQKGGEVRDVSIRNTYGGINVSTGTFTARDCTFDGVANAYSLLGSSVATIDETGIATPVTNSVGGHLATILVADSAANVTFVGAGGSYTGPTAIYVSPILVRGHSTLVVNDFTISKSATHAVTLFDNGHLTLNDVTIDQSGFPTSSGPDQANIAMGGQNTEAPMTSSLAINGGAITNSTGPGIVLSLYANTGATPSITLTNTHVDTGSSYGLWVSSSNSGTTIPTIVTTNTTFDGNGSAGMLIGAAHLTMNGGSVSTNKGDAIQFSDPTSVNQISVHGVTFDSTGGDALDVKGTSATTLDLGTAATAGNNVFTGVPGGTAAVHVETAIAGQAVGNTWMPNQQGADANGKYTTATTLDSTAPVGTNVKLASSATLVVK